MILDQCSVDDVPNLKTPLDKVPSHQNGTMAQKRFFLRTHQSKFILQRASFDPIQAGLKQFRSGKYFVLNLAADIASRISWSSAELLSKENICDFVPRQ